MEQDNNKMSKQTKKINAKTGKQKTLLQGSLAKHYAKNNVYALTFRSTICRIIF